jgi:hypothetical protein
MSQPACCHCVWRPIGDGSPCILRSHVSGREKKFKKFKKWSQRRGTRPRFQRYTAVTPYRHESIFLKFFLRRLRLLLLCSANTISVVPQSKRKRKRYHKETEKWYRLRLRLRLHLFCSANILMSHLERFRFCRVRGSCLIRCSSFRE